MDPAKWQQVKVIFGAALEQPAGNVASYIEKACGPDSELKAEVGRLLLEHLRAGDFLEQPVPGPQGWRNDFGRDELAGGLFAGPERFRIQRKLGAGGFGEVYEAFDRQRNEIVALKCLRIFDPDQLYRLKREFRTLSDLRHPNLIQVYELFSGGEPAFFTMELLRGRDFAGYLRELSGFHNTAAGSMRHLEQLREYLVQLARGVSALHESDLLHCDIKPSNIFITDEGRVVLLDFGLVRHMKGLDSSVTLALAGTPGYLAPEQLNGQCLSRATDWYSVGAVLYEALTSHVPFEEGLWQALARDRRKEPPPPASVAANVPEDLDLLCRELLRADPGARPGGEHVVRALQSGAAGKQTPQPGIAHLPASPLFLCRGPQLQALRNAFDECERGATVCVHVTGASGVGKSATLRHFLDGIGVLRPNCVILNGRCYESEAALHRGLDDLIDRLARFLKRMDNASRQLLIPRHFALLAKLFPVLRGLEPAVGKIDEIPDPREQRYRAFASLRDCLRRISETYPLILWIDDLQWGDLETVRVLNDLMRAADPPQCLILLSYRNDNIEGNPVLSALDRAGPTGDSRLRTSIVEIEDLPFESARELAGALVRRNSEDPGWEITAETIARESNGNPHFISELVRYGSVAGNEPGMGAGAFGVGHLIRRRAGLLPEPALRLLELVAVAGQPLASAICAKAARLGSSYLATRGVLLREQLLRTVISAGGEELEIYHDQTRTAIASYLSPEALRVYHGLLAQALEENGSDDHERLAVHHEASGESGKAAEHLRIAASRAEGALSFDRAAKLYRKILEIGGVDSLERKTLLERLGIALSNAGRCKEAAEVFLSASEGCESYARLDLHRMACEQFLRSGHLDDGMRIGRSLLTEVGIRFPVHRGTVLALLLWGRTRLRLKSFRNITKRPGPLTAAKRIRLDACWTFSLGMSMVDVLRGAYFQAQYTMMAIESGDNYRISLGLSAELAMGAIDDRRALERTNRIFSTAIQLAEEVQNHHALGFANAMRGVVSWLSGEWQDCHERSKKAAEIYRNKCSGVHWELTTANAFVLSSLVFMGRWSEHAAAFPGLAQQAEERGDRYGAVSLPLLGYAYVSYLAQDQPGEAHEVIRKALSAWRDEEFHLQHCDALFGQIETFLYEGEASSAYNLLDRQWSKLESSNLLQIAFNRILATALRSRTALSVAVSEGCPGEKRSAMLRVADRNAKRLTWQKKGWGQAMGFLLHAGIASATGHLDHARGHLSRAGRLFEKAGMRHYQAAAVVREAQLSKSNGGVFEECDGWMKEQAVRNPKRIMDMLAPGKWTRD